GQLQNGDRTLGMVMATAQVIAGASSAGSALLIEELRDSSTGRFSNPGPGSTPYRTADRPNVRKRAGAGLLDALWASGRTPPAPPLACAKPVVHRKKRGQHTLADGDLPQLGETQLLFQSSDRVPTPAEVNRLGRRDPASLATAKLAEFARDLAKEPGIDNALTRLLDSLIEVVRADKGFVLVVNDG